MKSVNKILLLLLVFIGISVVLPADAQFDVSKCNQQENEADCRKRIQEIAKEIQEISGGIEETQGEIKTITGEITQLTGEINETSSEIRRKNSLIGNIKNDIVSKEQSLEDLNGRLRREKESLEKILRKRYELDDATLFEVLLSAQQFSDFYKDVPTFSYIQSSLSDSFEIIDGLKVDIFGEKSALEKKEEDEASAKYGLQIEQKKIEDQKKKRDQALTVSQQKEASLEDLRKIREAEIEEIASKLFELRDIAGGGIEFGTAYKYAEEAGRKTGVRPAFILAILQQESNLGKNVGTCNRNNNEPIWSDIMPGPVRYANFVANGRSCTGAASPCSWRDDQAIFKELMAKLGRPLVGTPLSCPIGGVGWGGAMGPSQFIPSTWKSYEARITAAVGAPANPWNARHAIHATAIYVSDLGASSQTYNAEKQAALRYYAGSNWNKPQNAFYGDGVMNRTIAIQSNIDLIK